MMKNIYIAISSAALCAAVLTGCQKENWFNGRSGDGMLSFEASVSPQKGMPVGTKSGVLSGDGIELPFSCEIRDIDDGVSGIATKGDLINTSLSTGKLSDFWEEFTVNAWNEDGTAFISGTQVNWNDSKGKWATGTPTAWTGASEKTFYAWTNLPESGAAVTNADASTFSLNYSAVPTDVKDQTDILMGWYEGNGDADGDGNADGVASLAFSHPLTSVVFVKGEMEGVAEIRSITLTGVYGSGDCAATYVKGATNVVPTYTWSNLGDGVKVTLGDNESYLDITSEIHMIGEPFILIPQDLSEQPVKLEVIVKTEAGNLAKISGTLSSGAWASGKITFYTIGYAAKPAVEPLCFTAEGEQSVTFPLMQGSPEPVIAGKSDAQLWYSYDKKEWTKWDDILSPLVFGTVEHPCVYLKGDNPKGFDNEINDEFLGDNFILSQANVFNFGNAEVPVTLSGNIMSLLDSSLKTVAFDADSYCPFGGLFLFSPVADASALELPAMTLVPYAYAGMFYACFDLENLPAVPATTLAEGCYFQMFGGCMAMTEAPELPALNLAEKCYCQMFAFSEGLETAPEIPATTVAKESCKQMFYYCHNLKYGPAILPAMTLAESCYEEMFYDVDEIIAPVLPATGLAKRCYAEMFMSSKITAAPELPATVMAESCYASMFAHCDRLIDAPELSSTTLARYCYDYMFGYSAKLKTSPILPAKTLVEGCYNEMFTNCHELEYIKVLATDITADNCLHSWVLSVAPTGTFVKDPALQTGTGTNQIPLNSIQGIPTGWTVYDTFDPVADPVCISASDEQHVIFPKIWYDCNSDEYAPIDEVSSVNLWYSYDKKLWAKWTDVTSAVTFGTAEHPCVYFVGDNPDGFGGEYDKSSLILTSSIFYFINPSVGITVSGNVMSLLDYTKELTSFKSGTSGNLLGLFGMSPVTDASGLVLPVETLTPDCYAVMFARCKNLIAAPTLPATNLASYCYDRLFFKCTSLTTAPALPATTLADYCYNFMFRYDAELVSAPVLPAETLKTGCYRKMFSLCSKLSEITMLAKDISAEDCIYDWVDGVASTGTFVKDPVLQTGTGTNQIPLNSDSGIPAGWDVVDAE